MSIYLEDDDEETIKRDQHRYTEEQKTEMMLLLLDGRHFVTKGMKHPRSFRKFVSEMIDKGHCIVGTPKEGVYIAFTKAEFVKGIKLLSKNISTLLKKRQKLIDNFRAHNSESQQMDMFEFIE